MSLCNTTNSGGVAFTPWRKDDQGAYGFVDIYTEGNIVFGNPFKGLVDGGGFEANLFIGPGVGVSIDRIQDAAGGNDLYLSFSGGVGADISVEGHGNIYDRKAPGPENVAGLSYFWSAAYGPLSVQRSGTINTAEGTFGDYYLNSPGVGFGTPYLVGGGKVGLTYTFNLSDLARTIQGYQTR